MQVQHGIAASEVRWCLDRLAGMVDDEAGALSTLLLLRAVAIDRPGAVFELTKLERGSLATIESATHSDWFAQIVSVSFWRLEAALDQLHDELEIFDWTRTKDSVALRVRPHGSPTRPITTRPTLVDIPAPELLARS